MAVQIQTRRSSTANDRPFHTRLGAGELALNNHSTSPGLFFADNVASPSTRLIKVGPVHIGSTAPTSGKQGTGDGGNPYNTRTQNKDTKGSAESGKDRK